MKTDIDIVALSFPNRTEKSLMDYSQLRKMRVKGVSMFKGTVESLVDFTNDVEVFYFFSQ
jgi:hypothetical protein